ncbi:MAG: DUF2971 domain-containing protein [Rhodobacterales bacterium]|nr:DUF2971 domain-containing protein [Rhodobacterales bacterium]
MNDLRSMNDPRENTRGNDFIISFLNELSFPTNTPSSEFNTGLKEKFTIFQEFSRSFSFSTSTVRDDLYSWINYGARGSGFCIGFNRDYFPSYMWNKVIYDDSDFRKEIERIWNERLKEYVSLPAEDHNRVLTRTAIDLQQVAAAFKHQSWRNEQEERLMIDAATEENSESGRYYSPVADIDDYVIDKRVNFRFSGSSLKPYMCVDLSKNKLKDGRSLMSPIAEVIIGANNPTQIEVIEYFLDSFGFSAVRVSESNCKFR